MSEASAQGGLVAAVAPGAAADGGLTPGDRVLAVDGHPLRDVIDWWWLTDEASFALTVARGGQAADLIITRTPGEPLGVSFTETLFTPIRECENACAFCFVSQLPSGLRKALYVRDDDIRLSFLAGNFVTLTNVTDDDIARVKEQHLSPLHVSVHAVDPDVRRRLICPTSEDRALEVLDRLLDAGIDVHVQVVLVPGVNDGGVLDQTLAYLLGRTGVASVGCVPMGITAHQMRWSASYTPDGAAAVLAQVRSWQQESLTRREDRGVYAADEFYLLAGEPLPPAEEYDGYPQFENGIGMARAFSDEFRAAVQERRFARRGGVGHTLVTGELFAPVLRGLLAESPLGAAEVLAVSNRLFGGNVNVTGLLGGADIAAAIARHGAVGRYLVPDVVLNSDALLLDDVRADELPQLADADVRFIGSDADSLVAALAAG